MKTLRKDIVISEKSRAQFRNLTDLCVGTGRVDLAMQQEYQQQLRAVQEACHFRYIRGHGLFSDQMGICQVHTDAEGRDIRSIASPTLTVLSMPGANTGLSLFSNWASCPVL